jgi:pimeloyl-ACP methyl ester carboxylesterase
MPSTRFIPIGDSVLEVLCIEGDPDQTPLVFLHEGLGSVAMWRDWPAQVCAATGRRGVVYSRRGYGQSSAIADVRGAGRHAADYMRREADEVLPVLLAELGMAHQPLLIGHSDGATIALLHASAFACAGCVIMAPHLFVEPICITAIEGAKQSFETTDLPQKLARYHADVQSAFWQWCDVWLSEPFSHFNMVEDVKRITCPVLAIQGFDDAYGTMAQIDAIMKNVPDAKDLRLPDCGHSPHKDQPQAVTDAMAAFAKNLP